MKRIITSLFILSSSVLFADESREINLALKVSTLGVGVDISTPISEIISTRFNMNGATYGVTESSDGIDFEGDFTLFTAGLLVDYYPFINNFRFSSGVYYNGNGFTGSSKPSAGTTVDINGQEYTINELGSLDSEISFNTIAPYLGLGWGNNTHEKGWGVIFDLGVLYHGSGTANLTAVGASDTIVNEIENDIVQEEKKINDDLEKVKFYPVVALGVNYTF